MREKKGEKGSIKKADSLFDTNVASYVIVLMNTITKNTSPKPNFLSLQLYCGGLLKLLLETT